MEIKNIDAVFDGDGLFSKKLDNYEYREGQHEMARLIAKSYMENSITAIEAGTGIGKSFAYLVVALLAALEDSEDRTIIATSTINLQRQLFEKDIPLLFDVLGKSCSTALLLGRKNYICKRRFYSLKDNPSLYNNDYGELQEYVKSSKDGILFKFEGSIDGDTKAEICSDSEFCINSSCPYFRDCFFFKAKVKADKAQIIISNHHLLFSDGIYRYENDVDYSKKAILPNFNRLIIDEAHNIEGNATDLFSEKYDFFDLKRKISRLTIKKGKTLAGALDILMGYSNDQKAGDLIIEKQKKFISDCETLNLWVSTFLAQNKKTNEIIKNRDNPRYSDFFETLKLVDSSACEYDKAIQNFKKTLQLPEEPIQANEELTRISLSIVAVINLFHRFLNKEESWSESIHFMESIRTQKGINIKLCCTPLDIQNIMREAIFDKIPTVICTSATLTFNKSFAFWFSRIGLPTNDKRPFYSASYDSPFDYQKNLLLLLPEDGIEYSKAKEEDYRKYVNSAIIDSALSSGGGALILFTNKLMMNASYEECKSIFEENDITPLVQGMRNKSRSQILNEFKEDSNSVLFATNSFWEGVDVPGNSLRLLIIVKLPFASNDNPVFSARLEKIEQSTGNGFINYSVPETTLKLKQGFGRLIRNDSDRGIVLILDKRIISKNYGKVMIKSLPESYVAATSASRIGNRIEDFLY